MLYWDSAAILKLYVEEPDSALFLESMKERSDPIYSSAISSTELLSALYRKERAGELKPGGARGVFRKISGDRKAGRIALIPYGDDVAAETEKLIRLAFVRPKPVMIRSLDLIHAASALVCKAEAMVTTDSRLRDVAKLARLPVIP